MLILARYKDERIVITTETGKIITIQVLDMSTTRQSVRLGFEASKTIKINREEVEQRIGEATNGISTDHTN